MLHPDLLEPEVLYKEQLKDKHHENVVKEFENLTKKSHVDPFENKDTCTKLYKEREVLNKLYKKSKGLKALKALFIILCFVIIGIFLLIFVHRPKRKALNEQIAKQEKLCNELLLTAKQQMAPLNALFESTIPSKIMEKTTPLLDFDRIFDVKKYELLREKYGLWNNSDTDYSTLDLQSGNIYGNPFVIFKKLKKDIVMQRYEGSLTVTYTVVVGNSSRTVTETLRAHVDKPKPVYGENVYLVYGCDAANELSFTREPSKINKFDDQKEIDRYVRHHEDDLEKMAEKATKKGKTYTPLGNSEFELFFGAFDRDNEIQFRLLFSPLAQKSLLDLMKSKVGFGDDFYFKKTKGLNVITTAHSQGKNLFCNVEDFKGFDYEVMQKYFIDYNDHFFKCLFFDFAPLLSIPLYQQTKTREYIYQHTVKSNYNCFVHEVIANKMGRDSFAHKDSKTDVILKTTCEQVSGQNCSCFCSII